MTITKEWRESANLSPDLATHYLIDRESGSPR